MVTRQEIDAIRRQLPTFFNRVDTARLEGRLKAVLEAGLPDWDSRDDTILRRSIPITVLQLQAELETWGMTLLQSRLAFADGPYLDVAAFEYPAITRRVGESDADFRVRAANRHALLTLGSLEGIEEEVRLLLPAVKDVKAEVHDISRNITIYALNDNRIQLNATEREVILDYFNNRRDTKIAGVDIRLRESSVKNFYVHILVVYNPLRFGAPDASGASQSALQNYLIQSETIGAPVWSGAIHAAADTPSGLTAGVQIFEGDPNVLDITPKSVYRRLNKVWLDTPVTELANRVTEAPGNPNDREYILIEGGSFVTHGQTFENDLGGAVTPAANDLFRYDAGDGKWILQAQSVYVLLSGFLPPEDVKDSGYYYFEKGYPALSNEFTPVKDDLSGNEPIPALASISSYAAATIWHGANVYVSAEQWES